MRKKFGTIEALNDYFGVAEESFDNIALPSMPHGFWDIFEFKKWKSGQSIYDNLHFVYEGIRKFDKNRPIMSHVGLLRESNVRTNFIRADKLSSDCFKYKALYFPYYCMIDEKALPALQKFVSEGGVIIADEGFGLRTKNTWLQAYDVDFKPILNAKLKKRRAKNRKRYFITA